MKRILFLALFAISLNIYAQKVAIIGSKSLETTGDGVTVLALEDLNSGEVYYFTENEYNNTTNQFDDVNESVVSITITTTITKGNVIFFKEETPSTSNTFTVLTTSGAGTATVQHVGSSGPFSIGSLGESLYIYTDTDTDPTNGVSEIHAAFFPGSGSNPMTGGPIPTLQDPSGDFPNALVIDNFPEFSYDDEPYFSNGVNRVEYKISAADRTDVNRVKLENTVNYVFAGNDQDLSTTFFSNFNLDTSNAIATLTTSASQLEEDSSSNFNFTFSLDAPATSDLVINFTVNGGSGSGIANFGSDYTQTGATSMSTTSGTVTISAGNSSQTVILNPTQDTTLEPDETIQLSIAAGTGYDFGSPSLATSIIKNDDTKTVIPEVAITGIRHYVGSEDDISEFSFVALKDLAAGAAYVFSNNPFDKNTLQFADVSTYSSELQWTAPTGGIIRGDVIVVKKTAPNTFVITRNGSSTSAGSVIKLSPSKNFFIEELYGLFIAHTDNDNNPYNGISEIHSEIFTYDNMGNFGGTIPSSRDLSTLYVGSVLVDGFPSVSPERLEYKPSLRPTTTVDQANFENPTNWLYAEPLQDLSPIPFNNIVISEGSANPATSITVNTNSLAEDSGNSFNYTFNLSTAATANITINFSVAGVAQLTDDYTVTGADSFSTSAGTITVPNGDSSAQLTITPVNDNVLEPSEDIIITLTAGTGYDGGTPNSATTTITNDDVNPDVSSIAILGMNHLEPSGLSIVALEDMLPNSTFYFTTGEFVTETLAFDIDRGVLRYTVPNNTCIPKGAVLSIIGPENGPLVVECYDNSGLDCGTADIVSGVFDFFDTGMKFYAYTDVDTDPTTQVSQIHAVLNTLGGTLPPSDNPKLLYTNAVLVEGFPTGGAPNRTEFDPSLRSNTVTAPLVEDISNWLYGQANAPLSSVEFNIPTPMISCIANDVRNTDPDQCSYTVQGVEFDASFSNNCGETLSNNINGTATLSAEIFPPGTTAVVWTVTAANGDEVSCTTTVTVTDNQPAVANCAAPFTLQLDTTGNASITTANIDNGSIDNCAIGSLTISKSDFTCADIGSNTVTLTVTDTNGNESTCTTVVTVEDTVVPIALCQDLTVQLDVDGNATIAPEDIDNGSTDNCGIASLLVTPNTFTCADIGTNTVTLTITDVNGNSSTCLSTVTIEDNINPTTVCMDTTIALDSTGNAVITALDVDGGTSDACGITSISVSPSSFTCDELGANTVTLTATDANGNSSSCTAVVTITDPTNACNLPPNAVCQPLTVSTNGTCQGTAVAVDFDGGSSDPNGDTLTFSVDPVGPYPVGVTTVVLTVDDGLLTDTCETTITVVDNTPPIANCVAPFTVQLNTNGMVNISVTDIENGSTDACGIASITIDIENFDCSNVGANNVVLTVTDNNGNSSQCTTVVTVEDNLAPLISCPAGININTTPDICGAEVFFPDAIAQDECGVLSVLQTAGLSSGSIFPVGISTIEYTATDANGNISICSFNITVTDTTPPMALCQNLTIQLDEFGDATILATDVDEGSVDPCGIDTLSIDIDTFNCSDVGPNDVTLTATDSNGNSSSCIAVITIEDVTAPVAVCQNITVQLDEFGTVTIDAALLDGGSTDACGVDTLAYQVDIDTFDCSNVGDNNVILTVSDVNGNTSSCNAVVTVEDLTAPELVCMDISVQLDENGEATIIAGDVIASNTDLCGTNTTSVDISDFSCGDIGTPVIVTVFSVDIHGNVASCTATVTIEDTLGPQFDTASLPGAQLRMADENGEYILEDFTVGITAIDNCSDPVLPIVISQDPVVGTILTPGVYDITLSAIDDLGNLTDYVFELTVEEFLGIIENDIDMSSIVLSPVPASEVVKLSNPKQIILHKLEIYDLMGRLVKMFNLNGMGSKKVINVSSLASASYLIIIKGEGGNITKQLIKE